jgi:hypothetical protein
VLNPKKNVSPIGTIESPEFKHIVQIFNPTMDAKAQKE